ncbi:precorrin-2 dehydrogenase [Neobacillus kokaensis]|uniref:precorrin-2 dehydrogenase n=2 Tax=Neobacillus kokaensis TaxID=2759023 RepID=A0ABQ3MWW3_9BACI|nr:precorrin-2 dehydrogenase [Neobacillus kokaensis]
MQPFFINLKGKKVVIVGGGKIAARKAKNLETAQPEITFVAPEFSEDVLALSKQTGYSLIQREAFPADLSDAFMVILATNHRQINKALAEQLSPNQLICVVDEAEEGNVIFPAIIQRGQLQIAISTNGASPKLTRKLKQDLESQFDQSWETYLEFLSRCRNKLKKLKISIEEKNKLLEKILDDRYRTNEHLRAEILSSILILEE